MNGTVTVRDSHTQLVAKGAGAFAALAIVIALIWAIVPQALAATTITTSMVETISDQTYSGKAIEPPVVIRDGSYTLVKDKDFKVEYAKNVNVGQADVTITGVGDKYTGELTTHFSIVAKDINTATFDAIEKQSYTGEEIEPAIVVKDGTTTLVKDTDYTVEYMNNINAGTSATVKITGKGNYTGNKATTFEITPADLSKAVVTGVDKKYTGSAVTTTVTVTVSGVELKENVDYIVTDYYNNIEVGAATVAVKAASANCTGSQIGTFYITEPVSMNRLYNPNSGEHFYTASVDEKDWLVGLGWNDEGIGWMAPSHSATPVFRLYNEIGGEHHYTMEADERDALIAAGWKDEGTGWYSDDDKTTVLYREYNPNAFANNHNYTADKAEHDELVSFGWNDEGTAWYGLASA